MHTYDCGHKAYGYSEAVWTDDNQVVCRQCATPRDLMPRRLPRKATAWPCRFAVGERAYGPFIFFDVGVIVAIKEPNRYGLRMLTIQSDTGAEIGIFDKWCHASREAATAAHVERYGHPPRWRDEEAEDGYEAMAAD